MFHATRHLISLRPLDLANVYYYIITEPRRAAVALIIRVSPPQTLSTSPQTPQSTASTLSEFFNLDWVNAPEAQPEILFLKRDKPDANTDSGRMSGSGPDSKDAHVAFPGEPLPNFTSYTAHENPRR